MSAARRLSREQSRVIEAAVRRGEGLALCTISLLEIALLESEGRIKPKLSLDQLFDLLRANPIFALIPLSYEIASEVAAIGRIWDPMDRTIVATARVHGLQLLTADDRIIKSRLVPVIE
jgi:PIN domain nuclease of toxin-antitoxin system